jgi:hypothetical protein
LSLEYVLDGLSTVESHVKSTQIEVPYQGEQNSRERAKDLFVKWIKIYKTYTKGYQQELSIGRSVNLAIRMLSTFTAELETQVSDVFEAKISSAAYLFLHDFFRKFNEAPQYFVLSGYTEFMQTNFEEMINETFGGMTAPPSISAEIDIMKDEVKRTDIEVIRYDKAQFDNVLSFPLLLHEGFHCVYEAIGLNALEQEHQRVEWLREALIDIFVVSYFGPAYALSLATYLQKYPHKKSITHLSFVSRIFITLQYLEKAQKEKKLPSPLDENMKGIIEYLKKVWNQHKTEDTSEIQKQVAQIYEDTEARVKTIMRKYVSPFAEFLEENKKRRLDALNKGGFEFVENQTLSISDVKEYFQAGIPVAADPRVVFNSFISSNIQDMVRDAKIRIFITESLKKWHLKNAWSAVKSRSR